MKVTKNNVAAFIYALCKSAVDSGKPFDFDSISVYGVLPMSLEDDEYILDDALFLVRFAHFDLFGSDEYRVYQVELGNIKPVVHPFGGCFVDNLEVFFKLADDELLTNCVLYGAADAPYFVLKNGKPFFNEDVVLCRYDEDIEDVVYYSLFSGEIIKQGA